MYKGHHQAEILHPWDIFQRQKIMPSKMLVEKYPRLEERGHPHSLSVEKYTPGWRREAVHTLCLVWSGVRSQHLSLTASSVQFPHSFAETTEAGQGAQVSLVISEVRVGVDILED